MSVLALIPARGGSKGVPGKNLSPVYGKPLIAWTIEVALAASGLDCIIVSSDDEAILDIARRYPGVVPLRRPDSLAEDTAPITPVIAHALAEAERGGNERYSVILLLQPTAPMREAAHIAEALSELRPGVNAVISVCEMHDVHPARMYRRADDGLLAPMIAEYEQARRQDIPPAYYRNGSIYIVRRDAFEAQGAVIAKPVFGYVMLERYLLNIDEPRDMIVAEALVAAWQQGRL